MKGIQAYVLSKNYTSDTAEEFGAVKGAPCEIQKKEAIEGGTRITFLWENSEGQTRTDTLDVLNGEDGLGIKSVDINENGHLIVTFDDDTTHDAGILPSGGSVPPGGTKGQALVKKSAEDGDVEWKTVGGGGGSSELENDLTTSVTVGGIPSGTSYEAGTSLETLFRDMLNPVAYPTLTNPSASFTATGAKLLEKGATLNVTFTLAFNRGSINPAYGTSGYRSGVATSYTLDGTTQSTNTFAKTITEAKTSYQGSVAYEAGEQPKDSTGKNYQSPLPAGSVNSNVVNYEFVDAMWSNVSNIGTIAKMALVSKSAKQRDMNFPAQTVANPETFDIPASWTVTAVQVKNDLSGVYEDALSQFTVTDTTHNDAAGNSVNYKRYTFNLGYPTGARSVRVKWS